MADRFSTRNHWLLTTLVVGSVLTTAQSAHANSEFREFRADNPGIDRHQLRQMFREQNRAERLDRASGAEQRMLNLQSPTLPTFAAGRSNFAHRIVNQIERGHTIELGSNNRALKATTGLNFDLTSVERNIVLGENLLAGESVQITVGGESKTVASGSRVTAAEYLAVKQALGAGQTLQISSDGSASGGTLSIDGLTADKGMRASSLVISEGVTATGNFAKGSAFKLTGDLTNFGNMLVLSDRRGASLQGDAVLNAAGASIAANGDLHIGAIKTFTNDGIVTADGALTITAGESIKNTSSLSAQNDVTLYAASINNSGSVGSSSHDVNIYGPSTSALSFNNTDGTVSALNGGINFREASYNGSFNSAITGGDLFSKTVNMSAGQGVMDLSVDKLTGTISQSGYAAHVTADTDNLNLGNVCLTGDPTYINAGGNITINGDLIVEEALVIIARNDIILTTSGVTIKAGNETTGFPITILAGANITAGTANSSTLPTGATASSATITGNGTGSTAGGSVLFTGVGTTLDTRATGKKGSGANVFIGAQKGTDLDSGTLNLAGLSISTGGRKSKDFNGSVTIAAGGSADGSLVVRDIDTTGGTAGGGTIQLRNAAYASTTGAPISWNASGVITSGNTITVGTSVTGTASDVTVNGTVVSNADVSIYSADDVLLSNSGLVRSVNGNVLVEGHARIFTMNGRFQADNGVVELSAGDVGNNSSKVNVLSEGLQVTADVGSAFINSTGPVTLNGSSTAVNTLSILSSDNILSTGTINAGTVSLNSTGGQIEFAEGASVTTMQSINVNTEKGKIIFGQNSSFLANNGGIFITQSSDMGPDVAAPKFTTVTASGGVIEFKGAQAKGKKPENVLTATDGTIRFGSTKKNSIRLSGGVTMLSQ